MSKPAPIVQFKGALYVLEGKASPPKDIVVAGHRYTRVDMPKHDKFVMHNGDLYKLVSAADPFGDPGAEELRFEERPETPREMRWEQDPTLVGERWSEEYKKKIEDEKRRELEMKLDFDQMPDEAGKAGELKEQLKEDIIQSRQRQRQLIEKMEELRKKGLTQWYAEQLKRKKEDPSYKAEPPPEELKNPSKEYTEMKKLPDVSLVPSVPPEAEEDIPFMTRSTLPFVMSDDLYKVLENSPEAQSNKRLQKLLEKASQIDLRAGGGFEADRDQIWYAVKALRDEAKKLREKSDTPWEDLSDEEILNMDLSEAWANYYEQMFPFVKESSPPKVQETRPLKPREKVPPRAPEAPPKPGRPVQNITF